MLSNDEFHVNPDSPIAVYVQIENQIRFAIASGRLKPGDHLPSVRDVSDVLDINPNTVTKAYRDLELMKLVNTRRGIGVTVADQAPKLCRGSVKAMTRDHLYDAVAECSASGYSKEDILKTVKEALAKGVKPYENSRRP